MQFLTLVLDDWSNFFDHFRWNALFLGEFRCYFTPRLFVQFVDRAADGREPIHVCPGDLDDGRQNSPIGNLQLEVRDFEPGHDFVGNRENLGVGDHNPRRPRQVDVTLVELSVPPLVEVWLVSSVHLSDVEPFDFGDVVRGTVSCERHCQIVSKGKQLAPLVFEVVNQLGPFFSVLTHQRLLQLEDRRVDFDGAVLPEGLLDEVEGLVFNTHGDRVGVFDAFGDLRFSGFADKDVEDVRDHALLIGLPPLELTDLYREGFCVRGHFLSGD